VQGEEGDAFFIVTSGLLSCTGGRALLRPVQQQQQRG
jgi:hypothetical protein